MHRSLIAAVATAALTIGTLAAIAGPADALPLFHHTGGAAFGNVTCLPSGAWQATLNITATNPELHPKAIINVGGQPPMAGATVPFTHAFMAPASAATMTAGGKITWDDGFTVNFGPYTANRPDGCTPPTTQPGVTTTTTCEQAIPPRGDCGTPTTTTAPATTVPPDTTTVVTLAPSIPPITPPDTTAPTAPPTNPPAAHSQQIGQLPATGASTSTVLWAAGAALVVGLAAVAAVIIDNRKRERAGR